MKISKTLFKNLARCDFYVPLYDMYIYKNDHHVKKIFNQEIINDVDSLDNNLFRSLEDVEEEIFNHLYEKETGEDLTLTTLEEQTAILYPHYEKVEKVANIIFQKVVGIKNVETQKCFRFHDSDNEYLCFLDIYSEDNNQITIIEVKATTSSKWNKLQYQKQPMFIKKDWYYHLKEEDDLELLNDKNYLKERSELFDKFDDVGKYIYDLAIERMIVENSLKEQSETFKIPNIKYYLAILNNNYKLEKDVEFSDLDYPTSKGEEVIVFYDLTNITYEWQTIINDECLKINNQLKNLELNNFVLADYCRKPNDCKFKKVCHKNCSHHHSVMELNGLTYEKRYDYVNNKIYNIVDISDELKSNQLIQKNAIISNKPFINYPNIKAYLEHIEYPIYHLDFESFNSPLPRFIGEIPYVQSLFQFSIHKEEKEYICDNTLNHYEYISPDDLDHRLDLARKMIEIIDLSKGGTVLVYNQRFEKDRIKELITYYPAFSNELQNIIDHIYDLELVLKGSTGLNKMYHLTSNLFNYYHPKFYGSFSIKKVLPALTNVSYDHLSVKNGSEAIAAYSKMVSTKEQDEYLKIRDNLSKYCAQDTWSMVEILWKIKEVIK